MVFNLKDLNEGLEKGSSRVKEHFKEVLIEDKDPELKAKLSQALEEWPSELSSRFVVLFVELSVLATASRIVYKEPVLNIDHLRLFLGTSAFFFNSFTHK